MISDVLPKALLLALAVQVSCQIFKFFMGSLQNRRLSWRHLVTFGGMPSAHSAFVTALAVSVGILEGFTSSLFAVAAVFGGVVILDALKLRGQVQKQAIILNRLQKSHLPEAERLALNEMVGHTGPEILVGIVLALAVAGPLAWVWR